MGLLRFYRNLYRDRHTRARCRRATKREACVPADGLPAGEAHAGWGFAAGALASSLPTSGLQAPQLVPAFSRRPMASIFLAPLRISAEIWRCPTPKHEQTIGPMSSPASSGCPVSSDIRAFGESVLSANRLVSHERETSLWSRAMKMHPSSRPPRMLA